MDELLPLLVILACVAVIVSLRLLWQHPAPNSPKRPGLIWHLLALLLFAGGLVAGKVAPILWVILASGPIGLAQSAWTAVIVSGIALAAVEISSRVRSGEFSSRAVSMVICPLLWGITLGSIVNLLWLVSVDWKVDLTV